MITLLGKSGSGKNSVLNELVEMGYARVVSFTTRSMRPGEKNGVDYWFVDEDQFEDMQNSGAFASCESYMTTQGIWRYGFTWEYTQSNAAGIINPSVLKTFTALGIPTASFYLNVSDKVRIQRLKLRGDNLNEVKRRMKTDRGDFKDIRELAQVVINDEDGHLSPKAIAAYISNIYKLQMKVETK